MSTHDLKQMSRVMTGLEHDQADGAALIRVGGVSAAPHGVLPTRTGRILRSGMAPPGRGQARRLRFYQALTNNALKPENGTLCSAPASVRVLASTPEIFASAG